MENSDFCELTIRNFLSVRHFQAKITPIVVLYGDNGSGKSIVAKLFYAMQQYYSLGFTPFVYYSSGSEFIQYFGRRPKDNQTVSGDNSNLGKEESLGLESLHKTFTSHAGEREGLPISKDLQDYFLTRLCDNIRQQFSSIPKYFGYKEWKKLIGDDENERNCVFSSTNSKFQGKVTIKSVKNKTLIKPELKLYNSQRIFFTILSNHNQEQIEEEKVSSGLFFEPWRTDEEKVPPELLSELWDDPIFTSKSIHLSIQQNDESASEKFKITIPDRLYESIIVSYFIDSEQEKHRTDGHQDFVKRTTIDNDFLTSPIRFRLEDLRRNMEKHKTNKDLEKKIKSRLLEEFVTRILDVLAIQLPFNLFPNNKESLFFPPGKMQIMLDFNRILQDFVKPGSSGLYEATPEIRDFLLFILRSTGRMSLGRSWRETEKGDLLEKLREIQGNVYLNNAEEGKFVFYNERTKKESPAYDVPSSILSLMPFDLLLRGIGLNPRRVSIIFEELENHLHPSNIEKLCKLITELCLMSRKDDERSENWRSSTNMIITTHSFHVLFFLLFAVGSKIHPKKVKEYYTAIRLDLSENQEYTVCKVIDIDKDGYFIDPYVDEDISIDKGMQKWIKRWKEPIEGEGEGGK